MKPVTTSVWTSLNDVSVRLEMLHNPQSLHWKQCYDFVNCAVQRAMLRAHLPDQLTDDIVQQVMEAVIKDLPHFRGDSNLTTWLTKIVCSKVIDIQRSVIRNKGRYHSIDTLVPLEGLVKPIEIMTPRTIEEEYIKREQLRETLVKLEEFLNLHKHRQRNSLILQLALIDDDSIKEIAERLHIKSETVHSVVYQARQYLRENK